MKQGKALLGAVVLYLVATGSAFAVFRSNQVKTISPSKTPAVVADKNGSLIIDPGAPRTESCPLNGAMYTKEEREIWEKRRPLAVMVENSVQARPHSGIIRADVVYEAVSEGGVTRFMPVYLCDAARSDVVVAPVRSVRIYFIDWASEYGETPLFGHVGGANCSAERLSNGNFGPCKTDVRAQAIEQLSKIGWRYREGNDLDQFAIGAPTYVRNESRLGTAVETEHSVEGRTNKLWKVGLDRGWTNLDPEGVEWNESFIPWKFKDEATQSERGAVASITHDFWSGYKQFDVRWEYDAESNLYKRFTGGEAHLDLETQQQLFAKTVVVQKTKELTSIDDLKHNLYITTGEGEALIFMDGKVIEGYWQKKNRLSRTQFFAKKGQEVEFNRGKIWISVVSDKTEVAF